MTASADPTEAAPKPAPEPVLARARRLLPRILPVTSLAFSVTTATLMNRRPERAPLIVAFALLGWALVIVTTVVLRRTADADHRRAKVQRFVSLVASQTLIGQALAFPLPFFALASSWPPPWLHLPFALAYLVAVVVTAWDPFFGRVAARLPLILALQAFAAGAALLAVLPMLGLSNTWTFLVTGSVVGVGLPIGTLLVSDRNPRAMLVGIVAAVACALMVFVGAPLVPPAPLRLERGVMATNVIDREPIGASQRFPSTTPQLFCHTAIAAPLGLKDALTHVWRRDGVVLQQVELDVSGTGKSFRTWSRLTRPRPGRYRCRIETQRGQVVGEVRAVVE
jgi:hypothetical protein